LGGQEHYATIDDFLKGIAKHEAEGTRVITTRRPLGVKRFYTKSYEDGFPVGVTRVSLDEYERNQRQFPQEERIPGF